jgi:hypothetical protein
MPPGRTARGRGPDSLTARVDFMKFRTAAPLLLAALFSTQAVAEPETWMKRSNPNSLGLFVGTTDDCPMTLDEVQELGESEYLRARIKPTESLAFNLTANISCMTTENQNNEMTGYAISYEIRFGTQTSVGDNVLYEFPDYGALLIGPPEDKRFYLDHIRDSFSRALTDYLKANFK